jgi:hypothetical protein
MKTFKDIIKEAKTEINQLPRRTKAFVDKHVVQKTDYPVDVEDQFTAKKLNKDKTKLASFHDGEDASVYEEVEQIDEISAEKKMAYGKAAFADYHKQSKAKLGKILSGDKDTSGESRKIANRLKGISTASKTEETELDEGISNLSDARLKFHVLKDIPHGSYTKKEMAAEHLRRKKAGGPAYNAVKPSLNEESDLEEAKTDVYHKHMLKALGKSRLPKDHPYTSSIANNGDFVVRKGSEIAGRIPKGEHNLKEETMTPTDMKQREKIVKGMKKSAQDFKDRYGSKWKSVMYATATKAAMKEEAEQIDEKITEVSMKQLQKKFNDGTHEAMNDPKPGSHVELRNTKTGKRTTHYVKEEAEQIDESRQLLAARKSAERAADQKVRVDKKNYDWGKMITVHDGIRKSFPLHPEHQEKIKNLKDGGSTTFTDETRRKVKAHREGDTVHLQHADSDKKTSVAYSHFTEEVEQIDELSKKTLGSYRTKAARSDKDRSKGRNLSSAKMYPDQYKNSPLKAKVVATESVELDEAFKAGSMKLNDGSSVTLTNESSNSLNNLFNQLSSSNKAKMEQRLMSGSKGFNEILAFAKEV